MAGLAFTAYGIHWFAMAHRRYIDSSAQLDGWMAVAFLFLSILGVDVFRRSGDIPVMTIFVGLTLILESPAIFKAQMILSSKILRDAENVGFVDR